MSECSHNCESCSENCSSRTSPEDFYEKLNAYSSVKKVIGVLSGKGGVGKSMITSLLAVLFNRNGYKVAILDADITGPSIPKGFGINERAKGCEAGIIPAVTSTGIDMISTNMFLPNETDPTVWRGPLLSGTVKQFWSETIWNNEDYMFVDMPPGTGDVTLTVFQSIPLDGIIIVTSPQDLVSMIVEKAVKMANLMNIPILGIVENMSYIKCPDCNKEIQIFGKSNIEKIAQKFNISVIDKLPINPSIAQLCDEGQIENMKEDMLINNISNIENLLKLSDNKNNKGEEKMKIAVTYENGEVFQHFGHTENFKVYTIEDNKIISSEIISSNGTGHESLAGMLKSFGIETLICGGIGGGAKIALAQEGITVYPGAIGKADDAINDLLNGTLNYNPDIQCSHHDHEHNCHGGGKSCHH